jgi:L1 cell adhesion molecule like protein
LFWQDAVLEEGVDKMKEFFDLTRVEETELTEVARYLKVGLLCREFDPADRPTMAEVLDMLNGEKEVLVPARKNKQSIDSRSADS